MAAPGNSLLSEEQLHKALEEIEGALEEPCTSAPGMPAAIQPGTPADAARPTAATTRTGEATVSLTPSVSRETAQDLDAQLAQAAMEPDSNQAAAKSKRRFTVNRKTGAAAKEAASNAAAALAALASPKVDDAPKKPAWTLPKPLRWLIGILHACVRAVYQVVDLTLETISRPIEKLNTTWRLAIGFSGGIASIFSVVLILIGPSLRPKRDAITFVHEKRYELDHPRPKPVEPGSSAGEHGAKKEHSAAKSPEKKPAKSAGGHH